MSIVQKIIAGFAAVLLTLLVVASSNLISLSSINGQMNGILDEGLPLTTAAADSEAAMLNSEIALIEANWAADDISLQTSHQHFDQALADLIQAIEQIPAGLLNNNRDVKSSASQMQALAQRLDDSGNKMFGYYEQKLIVNQRVANGVYEMTRLSRQLVRYLSRYGETYDPTLKTIINNLSRDVNRVLVAFNNHRINPNIVQLNANLIEQDLAINNAYQELLQFEPDIGKVFSFMIPKLLNQMTTRNGLLQAYQDQDTLLKQIQQEKTLVKQISDSANAAIGSFNQLTANMLAGARTTTESTLSNSFTSLLILGSIAVAVAVIIATMIARSIRGAIKQFRSSLMAMANGDLRVSFKASGKDEFAELGGYLNGLNESLRHTLTQLVSSAQRLNQTSAINQQTANSSRNIADQQKALMEQTSAAMHQMELSVQEVADRSQETRQATDDVKILMRDAREAIEKAISNVRIQAQQVSEASSTTNELDEYGKKIDSVIETIHNIAEQTNLLALNAAIEAARAGEQGRGFAVVADEVRSLASRTKQSTIEIQETIELMQKLISAVVSVMTESTRLGEHSIEVAGDAEHGLHSVDSSMTQIAEMNIQVASATEEQSCTAREISQSLVEINQQAEQNLKGADQTAAIGAELTAMAKEQLELISHYKV
ncbi:methyl-accepting chemotaxis protein [Oceanobacter mangrovi]|uniref:methyl-accepting chemotaxis protein n=1 Tax=Oceanobacter mangrovi TaxID=2862510 RepID=UPI001C8EC8BD|nr:methyl-accepting chemotaxis protein [Oceanobacter mangrovi]